jgi:hypothetical protein
MQFNDLPPECIAVGICPYLNSRVKMSGPLQRIKSSHDLTIEPLSASTGVSAIGKRNRGLRRSRVGRLLPHDPLQTGRWGDITRLERPMGQVDPNRPIVNGSIWQLRQTTTRLGRVLHQRQKLGHALLGIIARSGAARWALLERTYEIISAGLDDSYRRRY